MLQGYAAHTIAYATNEGMQHVQINYLTPHMATHGSRLAPDECHPEEEDTHSCLEDDATPTQPCNWNKGYVRLNKMQTWHISPNS
jgi:hypothetical protein